MKQMNRTFVAAGLMLVTVAMAGRQEGTTLRRTLKENATDTYSIESKSSQTIALPNGMGDQDMTFNVASTFKVTTGKVDATTGAADVTTEVKVDKMDADGPMAQQIPQVKDPIVTKGTLTALNHFTPTDAAAAAQKSFESMGAVSASSTSGVFVDFPDKPVKIGDTWDVTIPKSPFTGTEDQKLTAKLVGEKKQGDVDVWMISITGTMKVDIDTSKLPKSTNPDSPMANQPMHIRGTEDMDIQSLVEKSTGRTVHSDAKVKSKNSLEVMGMNIDMSGTSSSTIDLKS